MRQRKSKRYLALLVFLSVCSISFGQSVPFGISYQAVARDNFGKEIVNTKINVRFSIIIGDPLGDVVFQELQSVTTSRYGVFTMIIGNGTPTGNKIYGELSQIRWSEAYHYVKVEVKFDNDFIDMGTMQFMAVPYALYAQKSLEPGPAGPQGNTGLKGDPGDPASDDQTISFDQSNLAISGGNSVPLTSLLQNLTITNSPEGNYLGISRGNSVLLATIEADGDPKNELQDLTISSDKLKITNNTLATEWDLSRYLDNTDSQALSWNSEDRILSVSGNAGGINLTELKNDADADPLNEIQDLNLVANKLTITNKTTPTEVNLAPYLDNTDSQQLSYNESDKTLSITNGDPVTLGSIIAFRASKEDEDDNLTISTDYDFITSNIGYNDGSGFNGSTGIFTAPVDGIYTFVVGYIAGTSGDSKTLKIFVNDVLYEILNSNISMGSSLTRSITMKLLAGDNVKVGIRIGIDNGFGVGTGTGSFSGFRVY
ncbi:MAG TPA: hypothetical protein VMV77_18085 [Bacteroidales bacterium]|nr:hypothetical protein [Bacteroidales bacterium]